MEASDRTRIAIYYAIWATMCAAVAGLAVALIHTWFFSYHPGRSAVIETLFSGSVAAVGLAAPQGAVPLVPAPLLAPRHLPMPTPHLPRHPIPLLISPISPLPRALPATTAPRTP